MRALAGAQEKLLCRADALSTSECTFNGANWRPSTAGEICPVAAYIWLSVLVYLPTEKTTHRVIFMRAIHGHSEYPISTMHFTAGMECKLLTPCNDDKDGVEMQRHNT